MPVISRIPAVATRKEEKGRGNNSQSTTAPGRPGYLLPTNSSLLRSGKKPDATRTRIRPVVAPPQTQKAIPVAFGTAIRPECKKVVSSPRPHTSTSGGAVNPKRLSSTQAVRPNVAVASNTTKSPRPIATALNSRAKASLTVKVQAPAIPTRTTLKPISNRSPVPAPTATSRPAVLTRGGIQSKTVKIVKGTSAPTFGAGIGRQAISRNVAGATKRSASPLPTKSPVIPATRPPLRDHNSVSRTSRTDVKDAVRQPRSASGRELISGARPAVQQTAGLAANKRATSVPLSTKRDIRAAPKVVAKAPVRVPLQVKHRQASKENTSTTNSSKNITSAVRSKLGSSQQAVVPTTRAIVTSRGARNGERKSTDCPAVTPLTKDMNEESPCALVGAPSESTAMDNPIMTSDVNTCLTPLPVELESDGGLFEGRAKVDLKPFVITAPAAPLQPDVFSTATPILANIDDAVIDFKVSNVHSPAHVGFAKNANRTDVATELATIPSIDSDELVNMPKPESAAEEVKQEVLTPSQSLVSVAPVISDSFMSIYGLHEEQVGASIEVEESAGLPANAVRAVHGVGQNYWKSIFDVSDGDLSSPERAGQTDVSMDENQLAKIREEFSQPIPEPPIMKFADWVDPVLAMTAVGVVPKDLGEYTGPNVSPDGPIQPTGVFLRHPKAAALARQESETPTWRTKIYEAFTFKARTASAPNMSSLPSSAKTDSRPVSPPVDTPSLSEGSSSPPESPTPGSTRGMAPESATAQVIPQTTETVSTPFSSKRRTFSLYFSWRPSSA